MSRPSFQQGFFAATAPAIALVLSWLHGEGVWTSIEPLLAPIAVALTTLQMVGAALMGRLRRTGRATITTALIGFGIMASPAMASPTLALVFLLTCGSLLVWLWTTSKSAAEALDAANLSANWLQGAGLGLFAMWFLAIPVNLAHEQLGWLALLASSAVASAFGGLWAFRSREGHPVRAAALVLGLAIAMTAAVFAGPWLILAMTAVALLPIAMAIGAWMAQRKAQRLEEMWWEPIFDDPARLLVVTFMGTATLGGFILALPAFSTQPGGLALIDAFFTAFSATCVTGLIVLDTPTAFTPAGQFVILLLIQIGGLGIMTFSTAALALFGRRMSLRHESTIAQLMSDQDRGEIHRALRHILAVTIITEGLAASALTLLFFAQGDSIGEALWRGVFTAISAFCNAGFALQSDSLIGYQTNTGVLHVIALVIIIGGLSPAVVASIPMFVNRRRVGLQAAIVLIASATLLVLPAIYITLIEWSNTLGGMGIIDRLSNGWFQSVTLRTAGFNSVDIAQVRPATLVVMMILMFIGGSPGSTAGGIKTTTIALLFLVVVAALRGREQVSALGYHIPMRSIFKAAAVATMAMASVLVVIIALLMTQRMSFDLAVFEAISAIATVGLSIGGTEVLDNVGKTIIIIGMFAGRVGPLTLFLLLATQKTHTDWQRPEQRVNVG
ncbi:MAG: potassium transporter TrkH [Bradymonadaceae bacterium]|nr:potassium transporter TrkH [Lujinxingiaceae bacterium]